MSMDAQTLALVQASIRAAITPKADLLRGLDDLGWAEIVAEDRPAATTLLFHEHGRSLASSRILDDVVLSALLPREPIVRSVAVVHPLPPAPEWSSPRDGSLTGMSLGPLDGVTELVVAHVGYDGPAVLRVPAASARTEPLTLMDRELGWHRVTVTTAAANAGDPVSTTAAAVAAARRAISAEIIGAATTALDLTREHTSVRRQFGREIAAFQAVRHRLADAYVAISSASAALAAAWAGVDDDDAGEWSAAVAKYEAGRAQAVVATHTLQVTGAIGLMQEHPLHRFVVRAATLDKVYGSHQQIEAEIGRRLLGGAALSPVVGTV